MIFRLHVRGLDMVKEVEAETSIEAQFKIMKELSDTEIHRIKGFEMLRPDGKPFSPRRRDDYQAAAI